MSTDLVHRPVQDHRRLTRGERLLSALYYCGLTGLVATILFDVLTVLLPDRLAVRVAFNSEGLVLALILSVWIQFVRPRLLGGPRGLQATIAISAVCLGSGVALFLSDLPSGVKTLNEAMIAAAVLFLYLQAGRRPRPRTAVWVSALLLLVLIAGHRTPLVTDLAETVGVLILAPLAFDVVDRGILHRHHTTSLRLRLTWYAFLVLTPTVFSLMFHGGGLTGGAYDVVRFAVRLHEAFVCILLVEAYFAIGLRRSGRSADA